MNKGHIKTKILTYIDLISSGIECSRASCVFIREDSYAEFLLKNKILESTKLTVMELFEDQPIYRDKSACANLFRMMCIIEYCKQKRIEL
jgi:type II secretory pathway component PulC